MSNTTLRRPALWALGASVAAIVLLNVACSVSVDSDTQASASTSLVSSTSENVATTTAAPTTNTGNPSTTAKSRMDPSQLVQTVSLTKDDVRSGSAMTHPDKDMTHASDPCKPVSSSPYLAGHFSPTFGGVGLSYTYTYYSQVAVEPSAAIANEVVASMSSTDWAQRCSEPANRKTTQSELDDTNAQTDCDLSLHDPTETRIGADQLPADVIGWDFSGTVHCARHNQDWSTSTITLIAAEGRTVILLIIYADGKPTSPGQATPYSIDSTDTQAIENMIERARSAQQL